MINSTFIKKMGDVLTKAIPISIIPVVYFLLGYKQIILCALIYGVGMLVTEVLKGVFDAPRPRETVDDHVIYVHGYSHNDGESLCSSHAMSAALPAYFALFFIKPWWVCIPFILLAWLCAWTRVKVKAHWPLDVIISNIIAFNLNLLVAYIFSIL